MGKREVVFVIIRIAFQILLLAPIFFFIFGFLASFEYPGINAGHLIYFSMLAIFLWAFTRLATSYPWHKAVTYFITTFIGVLLFLALLSPLMNRVSQSVSNYFHELYFQFMQLVHSCEFEIGKRIARLIGK